MYLAHYGLSRLPFQMTPDSSLFFESPGHKRALLTILYGLSKGEGFVVVTGAVGAGKTTLIERLMDSGELNGAQVARINTTQLGADSLLQLIAYELGVSATAGDKATLLRDIRAFLQDAHQRGRRVVLIVDEVQSLAREALEEMRMLSNFQDRERALLQILLVGQPEFRDRLAGPDCEQIRQRVAASYHLGALGPADTRRYIAHRLAVSGWAGGMLFTDAALDGIARVSGGVPRRINRLCDRLLLYGYLEDTTRLDGDALAAVVAEMHQEALEPDTLSATDTPSATLAEAPAVPPVNGTTVANGAAAPAPDESELQHTVAVLRRELAAYKAKLGRIVDLVSREQQRLGGHEEGTGRHGF